MRMYARVCVFLMMFCLASATFAQVETFASPDDFVASLNKSIPKGWSEFKIWNAAVGDLNGDGIGDNVLILSYTDNGGGGVKARLVVLAGVAGGRYSVLSESAEYCGAQKFYNLEISGPSLYVQAVNRADAGQWTSSTSQFRFNKKLGDFELIGGENLWETYAEKNSGRLSENFMTGVSIESKTVRGLKVRDKKIISLPKPLIRLNGLNC